MNLIEKYNLKKSDWVKKSAQAYMHLCYPWVYASILPPTSIKDPIHQACVCLFENDLITVYWNSSVMKDARDRMLAQIQENPDYLKELKAEYYQVADKYVKELQKIDSMDLTTINNTELCDLYDEFYKHYVEEFKYFLVLGEAVSHQSIDFVEPLFHEKLGSDFDTVFPILTHPSKPSFIEEERSDRNSLISSYLASGQFDEEALQQHAAKYFYINSNYANGEKLTVEQLKELILKDIEQGVTGKEKAEFNDNKTEYIEKYNLSDNEKLLLTIVDEFFKLVDDRKKHMMMASYYQIEFLKELARRTGINFKLLTFSIQPEVRDIISGNFDRAILEERSGGACPLLDGDQPVIYTGKDFQSIRDSFLEDVQSEHKKEVIGKIASKGKVSGTVKIVLKAEDISKVEQGDILVASMTRPEMVPAMKLAAAFVTNEGGITCHAAIVAREMGKPCVISTKVATEVFKDGDRIEVDADNGIVKIIN